VSSTGTKGDYYVVSVAGSTTLDGESSWGVGDWVVFNNSTWQKVDGGSTGNLTTAIISTSLTLSYGTASTALALDASKNVVSLANTGTGNNVLATSPTLVTPALGTPSALVGTNITGTAAALSIGGTAANVTGIVAVVNGGTGTTTPSLVAGSNVSISGSWPNQTVNSTAGSGDVVGPASATDNALARFDTTTGELIQNSVAILSDAGVLTGLTGLTSSGTVTLSGGTASTALALNASKEVVSVTNTGTGDNVLANSPTLITPALGTPSSGVVTNLTGTASININGTVGATTANTGTFTVLTATSDSAFTSTGALTISKGDTAARPTPVSGMLRFNTQTTEFEGYNGTAWASVGGAALSNDTSTATNVFPLFASATTGTASTLFTSNAQYLFKPSTGELSVKAPRASNGIVVNSATITSNYTIAVGDNGMSAGPVTVNSGITVTVSSGSVWAVI
jgi:hypothetical protein